MPTVKCSDCGNEVSTKAEKCPHCGRPKKKTSVLGRLILILFGVSLLAYLLPDTSSKTTTKPSVNPVALPAPIPAPKPIPSPSPRENALKEVILKNFAWHTSVGGNIMEADFTILNQSEHAIKDVKITCTHYAKSGTRIDSSTRIIYEIFPPRKSKTIKDFNMGFIHSQASTSNCEVVDLQLK